MLQAFEGETLCSDVMSKMTWREILVLPCVHVTPRRRNKEAGGNRRKLRDARDEGGYSDTFNTPEAPKIAVDDRSHYLGQNPA